MDIRQMALKQWDPSTPLRSARDDAYNMNHIAILDFGSQYTHLIARRIRDLNVLSKIYPTDISPAELPNDVIGIILSGGPQSVYDPHGPTIDIGLLNLGKPTLGLCYGHQLLAHLLGGEVKAGDTREYGQAEFNIAQASPLLQNIKNISTVWMSHGDTVTKLAPGFNTIGSTNDCFNAAVANEDKRIYGLQFHPEVHHTAAGKTILSNFVFNICGAKANWKIDDLLADLILTIQNQVKNKKVFLLVSGGVDSSVCFALLERALGKEKVYGLHIDTGFMRKNESQIVIKALAQAGYSNLHNYDASADFFKRLENITEPEAKRKIIGQTFLDIKDKVAADLGLAGEEWLLGQGTIYPDTIESGGTKHADKIKTHHNRVDAITELIAQGRVIEPLADFYKDEVRALGCLLGLPNELVDRHPFPGPGLAIRALCHCEPSEAIPDYNHGIATVAITLPRNDIKYFILPIRSVGVQGDNRTYAHPLAIWGETDWEKLDALSSQITNTNKSINRVLLLLNPDAFTRHPERSETESKDLTLTKERVELLREIDTIVNEKILAAKLYNAIWQFPVVLIPFGEGKKESIVLRPIISEEAMTAHFACLPKTVLDTIVKRILDTQAISYVFYDITNKPPGTIEWE